MSDRIAKLETALRLLLTDERCLADYAYEGYRECVYCNMRWDCEKPQHAPGCPILAAIEVLEEG